MRSSSSAEVCPSLEASLTIDRVPILGESVHMSVRVTNRSSSSRVLMEHVSAQVKEFNSSPQESFWTAHKELHLQPSEVLTLRHVIAHSEYEAVMTGDHIVNVAVVIKDVRTKERVLATQEFNMSLPQISIELEGGDSVQMNQEHIAQVSFTNHLPEPLMGAVLTVRATGLLQADEEARVLILQPGEKIQMQVSLKATSPGTKVLMASFSHSHSPSIVSRCFHKVSVIAA